MPRNKSEIDPVRTAIMAYARAARACNDHPGPRNTWDYSRLDEKRKDCFMAIPPDARAGLGWGPRTNLQTIIGRYGQIDAA